MFERAKTGVIACSPIEAANVAVDECRHVGIVGNESPQALSNGVDLYHVDTGQWPDSLSQLVPKYLKDVHKDPWGKDYAYVRSGDGYDVYSYGPDKAQGGGDDITVHGGESAAPSTAGK